MATSWQEPATGPILRPDPQAVTLGRGRAKRWRDLERGLWAGGQSAPRQPFGILESRGLRELHLLHDFPFHKDNRFPAEGCATQIDA